MTNRRQFILCAAMALVPALSLQAAKSEWIDVHNTWETKPYRNRPNCFSSSFYLTKHIGRDASHYMIPQLHGGGRLGFVGNLNSPEYPLNYWVAYFAPELIYAEYVNDKCIREIKADLENAEFRDGRQFVFSSVGGTVSLWNWGRTACTPIEINVAIRPGEYFGLYSTDDRNVIESTTL